MRRVKILKKAIELKYKELDTKKYYACRMNIYSDIHDIEDLFTLQYFINHREVIKKLFDTLYLEGKSIQLIQNEAFNLFKFDKSCINTFEGISIYSEDIRTLVNNHIIKLELQVHKYNLKLAL